MRPASARRTRTSASEAASDFEAAASASEAFGSGCWRGNGHREAAQGFDPAADKAGKRQKDRLPLPRQFAKNVGIAGQPGRHVF